VPSRVRVLAAVLGLCLALAPGPGVALAEDVIVRDRQGNPSFAVTPGQDGEQSLVLFDRKGAVRAIIDLGAESTLRPSVAGVTAREDGRTPTRAPAEITVSPWGLAAGLGAAVVVLLVTLVMVEHRANRSTRALQELWRTFAEDRQRERDAYLRVLTGQGRSTADDQALELAETAHAELVRSLEQARVAIASLAERLQQR
jgi:hypothetical protein